MPISGRCFARYIRSPPRPCQREPDDGCGHRPALQSGPGVTMQRSRDRFLTTHTGSLPRPDDLIRMMYAKEEGVPVDSDALAVRVKAAGAEVVRRQAEGAIDLTREEEMATQSYAPYIRARFEGLGATANPFVYQALSVSPRLKRRFSGDPALPRRKTPACNAPISVRDRKAP